MNILIIGGGGREHALAWKLNKSKKVKKMFIATGNAGTSKLGENIKIDILNHKEVIDFSMKNNIDLVVIGPDDVLASGLVNSLQDCGIKVFGPTKEASEIEWSKSFAKDLMKRLKIPTAKSKEFSDFKLAKDYIKIQEYPLVIKADGLALGKGVIIVNTYKEGIDALKEIMLNKTFGNAGEIVLVEEFLQGEEISVHAFCDGTNVSMFPSSQDHKRIFDNDKGPNTGGMGTVSPVPSVSKSVLRKIEKEIIIPIIKELKKIGREYKGVLFPGIMLTKDGPKVLEFNARFGDPETQSYMRILDSDLVEIFFACIEGKLNDIKIKWNNNSVCCVVLASGGYPGNYHKGLVIDGIKDAEKISDIVVFHAGTKVSNKKTITNGGRVIGVSAIGKDLNQARQKAYEAVDLIEFEGKQFRKDIA